MVVVILILAMGSQKLLLVGKIYRLKFAGIAARVINRLPASSRLNSPTSSKAFFQEAAGGSTHLVSLTTFTRP
jgi:hypothetical protein